jgi:hypothetical protein
MMKLALPFLLVWFVGWGSRLSAHPLQPEAKTGFAAFQGMRRDPKTDPNLEKGAEKDKKEVFVVSTTQPEASLAASVPVFQQQAADLIKIAEDLGLEITPKGAAMKVFRSDW